MLRNLTISSKLIFLAVLMGLGAVGVGLYGVNCLSQTNEAFETVYNDRVVPLRQLKTISDMYAVNIVDAAHKTLNGNVTYSEGVLSIEQAQHRIKKNWSEYLATHLVDDEEAMTNSAKAMMEKADRSILELETIMQARDSAALHNYIKSDLYQNIDPITAKISLLIDLQLRVAAEKHNESVALYAAARRDFFILISFIVLTGALTAYFIIRNIKNLIAKAGGVVQRLAEGDFSVEIGETSKDEIGKLLSAVEIMIGKLNEALFRVRESSDFISSSSEQTSQSGESISQGASEQASNTEEISSSMEEMTANIRQSRDNAESAGAIAQKAAVDIDASGKEVREMVANLKDVAERIKIIGDIARQTDLLAINAAIEAARAGVHGKGFAVVATEVRKLAETSQKAAKEIDAVSDKTVEMAERSGKNLTLLVPLIKEAAEKVVEIAAAGREQDAGAEQINNAVQQLNTVTQQNASAAEELASSARALSLRAEELNEAASYFTLRGHKSTKVKREKTFGLTTKSGVEPHLKNGAPLMNKEMAMHFN